jgi:hypothetical protein
MSDERSVFMTAEQHAEIERHIVDLMRRDKNDRASLMMTLSLAYKFARPVEPVVPSNVVQFDSYSRKAPCA